MVVKTEIYGSALTMFSPNRPKKHPSGGGYREFERMAHKLKAQSGKVKVEGPRGESLLAAYNLGWYRSGNRGELYC
jgi:hypothetical protein